MSDVITEAASAGVDTVMAAVAWTLGSNLENLTLIGASAINATGNTLNNALVGNAAANVLDGGTGNDAMAGGAGDDTYVVNVATDTVTEGVNAGSDLVQSSVTWTLGNDVEHLTLTGTGAVNGVGNALDNVLTGNSGSNRLTGAAGNDVLDGGAGTDALIGGAGNDSYVVNVSSDVVTEVAGEGVDTILASLTWTLGSNLENLTLTGTTAINGTGNTLDNILSGNAGVNVLTGAAGNDTLDGGAGNDSLMGGAGADSYRFGRTGGTDTITDNDATAGVIDKIEFGSGIALVDLSFVRAGNDLQMSVSGGTDKLIVKDWYLGSANHVEQIRLVDGTILTDVQVQGMVPLALVSVGLEQALAPPPVGLVGLAAQADLTAF